MSTENTQAHSDGFPRRQWRDYLENILVAVFLAMFVRTFILTAYKVPTGSMAPTLKPGDFIFSFRLPYGFRLPFIGTKLAENPPRRGDIVVFTYPEQPRTSYVKRVIGLPGDVIKIDDGRLVVNSQSNIYEPQNENFIADLPNFQMQEVLKEIAPEGSRLVLRLRDGKRQNFGPLVVPPGEVFLLGDNRDASDDSRYWGTVPLERLEGRVILIWLSIDWVGSAGNGAAPTDEVLNRFPRFRADRFLTRPQ